MPPETACPRPASVARPPLALARPEAARPLVARLGRAHPVVHGLGLGDERAEPGRRIPVAGLDALWDAVAEREGAVFPVLLAAKVEPRTYGLLTYLAGCAASGHHALHRLSRSYGDQLSDGVRYRVSHEGRTIEVGIELRGSRRSAVAETFAVAVVAGLMASQIPAAPRPRETWLRPPAPPRGLLEPYRRLFGGAVRHAAPRNRLVYDRQALAAALRGSDPALEELLEHSARLRGPSPRPWAEAVREVLLADPEPRPSQAAVAARLGVGGRSLRRHLAAEGFGYQEVVDQVLRRRAEAGLREPGVRVSALAGALGYADAAAFRRAFRRWTGMSPAAYAALVKADAEGHAATPAVPWPSA